MALDLTSASSTATVIAAYEDNIDYDLQGSVSMCKDFIQAARILNRRAPEEVTHGNQRVKEMVDAIPKALANAESWLAANDTDYSSRRSVGSVILGGFSEFRG